MSKKITTAVDYIAAFKKKKDMPVVKAYLFTDPGEEMKIQVDIDVFSVNEDAALSSLINELRITSEDEIKGKIVSFVIIKLDVEYLLKEPIVDEGDPFFDGESISLTLKGKKYTIDVEDRIVEDITIEIDPKTEKRICTNIRLSDPMSDK